MPERHTTEVLVLALFHGRKDLSGKDIGPHSLRVAANMPDDSPDFAIDAALLHDVVEDTKLQEHHLDDLGYSSETLAILRLVTRDERESYEQFIERICAAGNLWALEVKIADNKDNGAEERLVTLPEDRQRWARMRYNGARPRLERARDRLRGERDVTTA